MKKTHNQKNPTSSSKGKPQIRIIGGNWRGRKLPVLDKEGLRPSTDRVRETLFNWLMPEIHEANCLDLFAGTGALGFEALSRGAQSVTMIEKDKTVTEQLKHCKELLNSTNCSIHNTNAFTWLESAPEAFDIIFLDPPFNQNLLPQVIEEIENKQLIKTGGYIYIEVENSSPPMPIPPNWSLHREKKAGQVRYSLYLNTANNAE